MKVVAWIVGLPAGLLLLFVLMNGPKPDDGSSYYRQQKQQETDKEKFGYAAIQCWEEYKRKSLSDYEKRSVASMCEGLEKRANGQ